MANVVKDLYEKGLTNLDGHYWMPDNMSYITIMGSVSYGVSSDTSDMDLYGFCIPPKTELFPHLRGEVVGFGKARNAYDRFIEFEQHHIKDVAAEKEYDLKIYNIVDYFHLVLENNPNMIDSLFTSESCVLHRSRISDMVRDNRKMFLHRGCWHTFKNYAFKQLKKMRPGEELFCPCCNSVNPKWNSKQKRYDHAKQTVLNGSDVPEEKLETFLNRYCFDCAKNTIPQLLKPRKINRRTGKRRATVEEHGFDPKFAYNVVRLLNEVEQILLEGNIDLHRNNEQLKAIRRGDWTLENIEDYFAQKAPHLENLYNENKANLPWGPGDDGLQEKIQKLLFECIEEHYGSLSAACVARPDASVRALQEIEEVLGRHRLALNPK